MHALKTAVIEHTTRSGVHHDWLIEDPRLPDPQAPGARLWTARVTAPPSQWPALKRFELTAIAPHRRAYLSYQGPVSADRGRVKRVAEGWCISRQWTADRMLLECYWPGRQAWDIRRVGPSRWIAVLSKQPVVSD